MHIQAPVRHRDGWDVDKATGGCRLKSLQDLCAERFPGWCALHAVWQSQAQRACGVGGTPKARVPSPFPPVRTYHCYVPHLAALPPERSPKCGGVAPGVTCLCGPGREYDRRCQRCRDARFPWRFGVVGCSMTVHGLHRSAGP